MNTEEQQENIELRMRTIRILWLAMLMSVVLYYVFTFFVGRPATVQPNSSLSIALFGFAVLTTLASFFVKNKHLNRALEVRQVQQVQQAYLLAWAFAEVAALLGVVDFFVTADRFYFLFFAVALVGQLLHFPRREHVEAAIFKNQRF